MKQTSTINEYPINYYSKCERMIVVYYQQYSYTHTYYTSHTYIHTSVHTDGVLQSCACTHIHVCNILTYYTLYLLVQHELEISIQFKIKVDRRLLLQSPPYFLLSFPTNYTPPKQTSQETFTLLSLARMPPAPLRGVSYCFYPRSPFKTL